MAIALACAPASSHAAVTGVGLHVAFSPASSSNKSATVTCPAGQRVLGAGMQFSADDGDPAGQLVLGILRPDQTLTSVTAQGREDESGTPVVWRVRADAVCGPAPPGLQRVTATSPSNSTNKSVTASCPTGKRILGFGAEIKGGGGQVAPNDIIPGSGLKNVTVTALEDDDGTTANWSVAAYAICSLPVAGLERIAASSATDSQGKSMNQPCPAGKQILSAGAELAGEGGQAVLNQLMADAEDGPSEIFPNSALVFAPEDEDGTSANWTARVFAVCAAEATRTAFPGTTFEALASCSAGTASGGGGDITGSRGHAFINGIQPGGAIHMTVGLDGIGGGADATRAYAICAPTLPGFEVVTSAGAQDFASPRTQSVNCPIGKQVIDAGGTVDGAPQEVLLTGAFADPGLTGVTATAAADESFVFDFWTLSAWAACATPPPGLELVTWTTEPDSDPTGVNATCPSGKNLLGTGSRIVNGLNPAGNAEVLLDDVRPNAALTTTTVAALEDATGFSTNWSLTAQAICANP